MKVIPVNAGALLLLLAGVTLLVVESYVTAHGLAGLGGAVCLLLGTMLFIDKGSPDYQFDPNALRLSPWIVWPTPLILAALVGFVGVKVLRSRRAPLVAGDAGLLGELGQALTDVDARGGEVFVHGEYWRARAEGAIPKGSPVRVVRVEGLVLGVEFSAGR
jgi:membrane-bound serine protease (ClpP class)